MSTDIIDTIDEAIEGWELYSPDAAIWSPSLEEEPEEREQTDFERRWYRLYYGTPEEREQVEREISEIIYKYVRERLTDFRSSLTIPEAFKATTKPIADGFKPSNVQICDWTQGDPISLNSAMRVVSGR